MLSIWMTRLSKSVSKWMLSETSDIELATAANAREIAHMKRRRMPTL